MANWGPITRKACSTDTLGDATYHSILWNIPSGQDWNTACEQMPPVVLGGQTFQHPTRCINTTNEWGEWDGVPDPACQPSWGSITRKACSTNTLGEATYHSILWNIPSGMDWGVACRQMPPQAINGKTFATPTRCISAGNEWAEWDGVPDTGCLPTWGPITRKACSTSTLGNATYHSVLWNIPPGIDWTAACQQMPPVTINGKTFTTPTRCISAGNEWAEWDDVPDTACLPTWGPITRKACSADTLGDATYHSVLWNIPPGIDWTTACRQMPPVTINGQTFTTPTRCISADNEWAEWDGVPDNGCLPTWGTITPKACSANTLGEATYHSILWNIPSGMDWNTACQQMPPVTINGKTFTTPTRCVNATNEWAEWDGVPDTTTCPLPTWGPITKKDCNPGGDATYHSILWNIPSGTDWTDACQQMPPVTINGKTFTTPTRCINTTNEWGEWDGVPDPTCPQTSRVIYYVLIFIALVVVAIVASFFIRSRATTARTGGSGRTQQATRGSLDPLGHHPRRY